MIGNVIAFAVFVVVLVQPVTAGVPTGRGGIKTGTGWNTTSEEEEAALATNVLNHDQAAANAGEPLGFGIGIGANAAVEEVPGAEEAPAQPNVDGVEVDKPAADFASEPETAPGGEETTGVPPTPAAEELAGAVTPALSPLEFLGQVANALQSVGAVDGDSAGGVAPTPIFDLGALGEALPPLGGATEGEVAGGPPEVMAEEENEDAFSALQDPEVLAELREIGVDYCDLGHHSRKLIRKAAAMRRKLAACGRSVEDYSFRKVLEHGEEIANLKAVCANLQRQLSKLRTMVLELHSGKQQGYGGATSSGTNGGRRGGAGKKSTPSNSKKK